MGKAAAKSKTTTTTATSDLEQYMNVASARRQFVGSALDMGWQLALTVLIPVFIGVKLDEYFDTSPSCTLAALFIAIGGACWVVARTMKQVATKPTKTGQKKKRASL